MKPAGLLLALAPAALLWAQGLAGPCSCGANPPGPPKDRALRPYADAPDDMQPYAKFGDKAGEPYYEYYTHLIEYNGGARDVPTLKPADVDEVRIGFLGPVENHPEEPLGRMMLSGVQLAIDEANAAGGYGGKPFKLMIHNDQAVWGASSNEIVKMAYDEKVWAMLGSIGADSTHIALRVTLKAEVPIVNSASTDPTIPETIIPWYLTTIQDDRVQGYTLARRIYSDLGLQRIALLRVNSRYGRFGVLKFKDVSRRMGHPVVIEQKWMPGDMDFKRQLRIINESRVDGIVIWGDAKEAGTALKQMREMGMKQRAFGSFRTIEPGLIETAGGAAEGFEAVYPYDPTRDDPGWVAFKQRFEKKFGKDPEAFASLGYDTMSILLQAICKGGLNRGQIRDALTGLEHYKGVTGDMVFDPNCKNIVPLYLATVKQGKLEYRRYPMKKEYARVGEGGVEYNGPALADAPSGPLRIGLFGPGADKAALQLANVLEAYKGRYEVVPVTANTPWGQGSTGLVNLIYEPSTIGMISTDRNTSHLAEQLAIKSFVPLIAISGDKSLTAVNIPWIFRLPADASLPDALRSMIDAAEKSGPNRGRLRAALASSARFDAKGDPR
ncbi:MAG TPA: ABC transporter substrate-binding protein [Bryobacteraceae bacterium]|nr:ABC transporter substrate-binding protein [Bryobacteraceae bacterium]